MKNPEIILPVPKNPFAKTLLFKRKLIKTKLKLSKFFEKKFEHQIGICLSGGSARGYAHVGVLKALSEHGIEPEIISGTSMGGVVGMLYAAGYNPMEIQEILVRETFSKVTGFSWRKTGLLKMEKLNGVLKKYVPEDDFASLKKPFYLGLTNLNEAKKEFRHTGPLYDYIVASCSVPGIFSPMYIEDCDYVDGGLMCNLPATPIREKCKILIGSHVNYPGKKESFSGPKAIMERAVNLGITQNAVPEMKLCDYFIDPPQMQHFSLFDFSRIEEIIDAGYEHTMGMIEAGKLPVKELV